MPKPFVAAVAVWLALVGFAPFLPAQDPARRPPNLLLIVADDMGYGDLSCQGSLQIATPNLDRLAADGVRCTAAYVSGPVCAPSRAGLLTGRHGCRFGFEHNLSHPEHVVDAFAGIPLDEPLLPERLHELGYRTGLVGKWHLGASVPEHHPLARGFETFFGMLGGHHGYWPTLEQNQLLRGHEPPTAIRVPYLTDWFTREAIDFVTAEDARPWFLYLAYNTPHTPLQARPDDLAACAHIQNEARRKYCAMQRCLDRAIGELMAALAGAGQRENTLVVFLSDNGGSVEASHAINAPLRGSKGTFLEGGVRVPMLWCWPGQLAPRVYDQPVSALDVMATFVTAAGGKPPTAGVRQARAGRPARRGPIYDSVDLLPFLAGRMATAPHEALFWRMGLRGSAVRVGDWKLVRPNSQLPQLYDLANDLGERDDRIAAEPAIAADLLRRLNAWEASLERNPIFVSDPVWSDYNRRLYEMDYALTQPLPDEPRDLWRMPPARR
ncbi:MAG: sulfatase-like hydrolase/transferase [Planctomycetes bacterium]|nr:sulfatase-like hydrolase/transferase [Planctomycetota bacterium]